MNPKEFTKWLESSAKLGRKSAADVLSRLNRAAELTDLSLDGSARLIEERLLESSRYKKLSKFVRPQLLRSVKLYQQFRSNS